MHAARWMTLPVGSSARWNFVAALRLTGSRPSGFKGFRVYGLKGLGASGFRV